jgi:hypothetical protein
MRRSSGNNEAEGKKWFGAAEKYRTASRAALLKNVEETLNEAEKKRLRNQAVDSQLRLVAIYLKPQLNGADKCIELLNQLEKDVAGDRGQHREGVAVEDSRLHRARQGARSGRSLLPSG